MSLANTPVVQVCLDTADRAKVKITAWYNGGLGTNITPANGNVTIQANTLFGANASMPACILDVLAIEGNVDLTQNTEVLLIQFATTANQNTDIMAVGGPGNAIEFNGYIPNNANTPTGDIYITIPSGKAGDAYTLMLTLGKNNLGVLSNGVWYGQGAWANGSNNT